MLKGVNGGVLIEVKKFQEDIIEFEEKLMNKSFFGKDIDFLLKEKDKEYYKDFLKITDKFGHNLYLIKYKEEVVVVKEEKKEENHYSNSESDEVIDKNGMETLIIKRTIRSGQRIEYKGNIVVVGDLNPGSELIADGDVYIFGRARGIIHAGNGGNNDNIILALSLEANQIRIGNIFTKNDSEESKSDIVEKAYVENDKIIVVEYKYL